MLGQLPECVVLPLCGLARAVRVAGQLAVAVVCELLLTAVGIDDVVALVIVLKATLWIPCFEALVESLEVW